MKTKTFITHSDSETRQLGFNIAKKLPLGSVVLLTGDLGAGKTTFTRGVAESFEITDKITSPTFNIMKVYLKGTTPLIHIDAYRLKDMNHDIGLDEYIGYESGVTLIEWPEFIKELLPINCYEINITNKGDDVREIIIKGELEL